SAPLERHRAGARSLRPRRRPHRPVGRARIGEPRLQRDRGADRRVRAGHWPTGAENPRARDPGLSEPAILAVRRPIACERTASPVSPSPLPSVLFEVESMGIFSRLAQLIQSNINDLIAKAEDPEKMLNQVVIEMTEQLANAKKQVAVSIADAHRLGKQFENEAQQSQEWERKAMMAVRAGNDELAKEALARKKEHELLAIEYQKQYEKQKAAV